MTEQSGDDKYIKCSKCKCKYHNDDNHIKADFGYNRLNERFKTCVKCRVVKKLDELPDTIINKILLYNSHPIAKLLKAWDGFKLLKCQVGHKQGCPYDRGVADAYYRREYLPHYYILEEPRKRIEESHMTDDESDEYYIGFMNEKDRKIKELTNLYHHMQEFKLRLSTFDDFQI